MKSNRKVFIQKKKKQKKPGKLHPRNRHQGRYDFGKLTAAYPPLKPFVRPNKRGDDSIDFANPEAVMALNKSLLSSFYGIDKWDIPEGYLCPPIPGRADYIHHIADLLATSNKAEIPTGKTVRCLDIGTGANVIYPIIGVREYGWSFVGTDIDPVAIKAAEKNIAAYPKLGSNIELRHQNTSKQIFKGIIQKEERFDVTICNPPFHASAEAAQKASKRKVQNLTRKTIEKPTLNFGGQSHELYCDGGEIGFVINMIQESKEFANASRWFSTLVSKESNVNTIQNFLKKIGVKETKIIPMGQGNKRSRIIAWRFGG